MRAGDWTGRLLCSTALKDMYLRTDALSSTLLEDVYLLAWRRFQRRVLVGVVTDNTTMMYTSVFMVPPEDATLFEARGETTKRTAAASDEEALASGGGGGDGGGGGGAQAIPRPTYHQEGLRMHLARQNPDAVVPTPAREGSATGDGTSTLSAPRPYHPDAVLSSTVWPPRFLPKERAIAQRIIAAVAPFEVYLVDLRPLADPSRRLRDEEEEGTCGAPSPSSARADRDAHYGAYSMPHRAAICKAPCDQPAVFGFISEFVVGDLLGVSL